MILSKQDYISLTTDLWKNKKLDYFLNLSVHFFDKKLNFNSLTMAFRKFKHSHHAPNIASFILKEINRLDCLDKVVSITTDNEATVKSACSDLTGDKRIVRVSCFCHNINLAVKVLKLNKK
jgi:hypothetical protein